MTILEEMISGLRNRIQKRIDEDLVRRKSADTIIQKAVHNVKNKANKQALLDINNFETKIKRLLTYEGEDPNYLLMQTNQAAGLFFSKHPEKNKREKETETVNG